MRIGYFGNSYPQRRNIIGIVPDADYVGTYNVSKLPASILGRRNSWLLNVRFPGYRSLIRDFYDFDLNRVDLLHLYNRVSYGKKPWITTFEDYLPRHSALWPRLNEDQKNTYLQLFEEQILVGLDALCRDSCKMIIAMSKNAFDLQISLLQLYPQFQSEIERKLTILHPPQPVLVENLDSKPAINDESIRFMFVGKAFHRKGGVEILKAFQELRGRGLNLRLIIVSSFVRDHFAARETECDKQAAKMFIHQNSDWIEYYDTLPNEKVLELMQTAHIGLLPTYSDTYGFSVLEFQAAGCPVISTDIRALTEINNDRIGWLIKVPKNYLGEALYYSDEDRAVLSETIKQGLKDTVLDIMANKQIVQDKAGLAIEQIRMQHSLEKYTANLEEIYHEGLV